MAIRQSSSKFRPNTTYADNQGLVSNKDPLAIFSQEQAKTDQVFDLFENFKSKIEHFDNDAYQKAMHQYEITDEEANSPYGHIQVRDKARKFSKDYNDPRTLIGGVKKQTDDRNMVVKSIMESNVNEQDKRKAIGYNDMVAQSNEPLGGKAPDGSFKGYTSNFVPFTIDWQDQLNKLGVGFNVNGKTTTENLFIGLKSIPGVTEEQIAAGFKQYIGVESQDITSTKYISREEATRVYSAFMENNPDVRKAIDSELTLLKFDASQRGMDSPFQQLVSEYNVSNQDAQIIAQELSKIDQVENPRVRKNLEDTYLKELYKNYAVTPLINAASERTAFKVTEELNKSSTFSPYMTGSGSGTDTPNSLINLYEADLAGQKVPDILLKKQVQELAKIIDKRNPAKLYDEGVKEFEEAEYDDDFNKVVAGAFNVITGLLFGSGEEITMSSMMEDPTTKQFMDLAITTDKSVRRAYTKHTTDFTEESDANFVSAMKKHLNYRKDIMKRNSNDNKALFIDYGTVSKDGKGNILVLNVLDNGQIVPTAKKNDHEENTVVNLTSRSVYEMNSGSDEVMNADDKEKLRKSMTADLTNVRYSRTQSPQNFYTNIAEDFAYYPEVFNFNGKDYLIGRPEGILDNSSARLTRSFATSYQELISNATNENEDDIYLEITVPLADISSNSLTETKVKVSPKIGSDKKVYFKELLPNLTGVERNKETVIRKSLQEVGSEGDKVSVYMGLTLPQ